MITLKKVCYKSDSGVNRVDYIALHEDRPVGIATIDCGEYTANEFNRVHDGLGMIVHRRSPAPNPFFVEDWSERFDGDALPENATSILIEDGDYEAWRASQLLAEYC